VTTIKNISTDSKETVPFRLSRNLSTFFGNLGIDGPLNATMTAIVICLYEGKVNFLNHLNLYIQDEYLIAAGASFTGSAQQKKELKEKIAHNTQIILQKIHQLSPNSILSMSADKTKNGPINKKVTELIQQAINPQNLSQMTLDPNWQPWI